jgi:hypothetical protein
MDRVQSMSEVLLLIPFEIFDPSKLEPVQQTVQFFDVVTALLLLLVT